MIIEESGAIIRNANSTEKEVYTEKNKKVTTIKKSFINYFSLGYDARVGFGFERARTSYRCCNKFFYFIEGLKKLLFTKSITLKHFIKSLSVISYEREFLDRKTSVDLLKNENDAKKDIIFKNKGEFSCTDTETEEEGLYKEKSIIFNQI